MQLAEDADPDSMESIPAYDLEEASREADAINGVPVWRLHGVKPYNLAKVRETDIWIHLSDLGAKGWGLMGSAEEVSFWEQHLAEAGITLEPWIRLPYKPWGEKEGKRALWVSLLFLPTIIGFFIAMFISGILSARNGLKCSKMRYAMGLSGVFYLTSISGLYPGRNERQD